MRWTQLIPVCMLALLLAWPKMGAAQSNGSSSSGMFGNRTTGTGTTSSTLSAFGSNTAMGSAVQSAAQGTPSLNGSGAGAGQARQPGSFIGANTAQTASQNFVGAAQAASTTGGQMGGGNYGGGGMGGGMGGGFGGGFGAGRLIGQALMNRTNTPAPPPVRTTLTLAPELLPPAGSSQ